MEVCCFEEMTKLQKPSVIYKDIKGEIFLEKNRQVGIFTKPIDFCHHFLRDMAEDKDIDIWYIRSKYDPEVITTRNNSEAYLTRHMKRITQGELWEIVETGGRISRIPES